MYEFGVDLLLTFSISFFSVEGHTCIRFESYVSSARKGCDLFIDAFLIFLILHNHQSKLENQIRDLYRLELRFNTQNRIQSISNFSLKLVYSFNTELFYESLFLKTRFFLLTDSMEYETSYDKFPNSKHCMSSNIFWWLKSGRNSTSKRTNDNSAKVCFTKWIMQSVGERKKERSGSWRMFWSEPLCYFFFSFSSSFLIANVVIKMEDDKKAGVKLDERGQEIKNEIRKKAFVCARSRKLFFCPLFHSPSLFDLLAAGWELFCRIHSQSLSLSLFHFLSLTLLLSPVLSSSYVSVFVR